MIVAHFRTRQNDQISITAYSVAMNFLKDNVAEFYLCDLKLAHSFGTEKLLAKIDYEQPKAEILVEGYIDEPMLRYVYLQK